MKENDPLQDTTTGPYWVFSLIRKRPPLGPYRMPMPGGRFFMGEVPL